ncbi:MAG: EAL domain-containing protein [Burkholderiaceae bacterium]
MLNCRKGEHEKRPVYYWTLFLAKERQRFEGELIASRDRAETAAQKLSESHRFIKSITDAIPSLVSYWDLEQRCRFANLAYLEWFGKRPEELLGLTLRELLRDGAYGLSEPHAHAALRGEARQFERSLTKPDGSVGHTVAHYTPDWVDGKVQGFFVTLNDVTQLKQTETALRKLSAELAQQHELLQVTLQSIGDAVITTDAVGLVTWLNPAAERMTGWQTPEAVGLPLAQVFNIVSEETRLPTDNPVATCLAQGKVVGLANHTLLISRDGSEYGIADSAAPIRNPQGALLGVVLVFHDVSEQRRLSGEMTHRATHDALTGLVNRAEFEVRLLRALRNAQDNETRHALLFIDLDQFKLINDACGHSAGDEFLQQLSKMLREAIRERDTLARLGGDEFAIILENCSVEQAFRIGQKICDRMHVFRFVRDKQRFRVGTSIGLVPIDKRWASTTAIQQAADSSCYAAKEAGRNRVHAWFDTDTAMIARQHEMQWTTRIERALDDDGFELFAQRIEALDGGSSGLHAEVLLRMKNEDDSLALPGAFLPAAERFHLVTRVDRWVLHRVIAWMKSLSEPDLIETLCINVSGQSVGDRAFHAWAQNQFAGAGPTICSKLCLEITETAAVTNLADAAVFIEQVRALGVKVALDDFGAGASSFGYLKSLRVDLLKIDGQFVRNLQTDPLDAAAVRCFADVARVIGVKTVAEFVDSPQALEQLRAIGVNYAQGYLIHRPEPIDALLGVVVGAER